MLYLGIDVVIMFIAALACTCIATAVCYLYAVDDERAVLIINVTAIVAFTMATIYVAMATILNLLV